MSDSSPGKGSGSSGTSLSPRAVLGILVAALVLVFFIENWGELGSDLTLRLIIPQVTMPTWAWMLILTLAGLIAGFLLGRSRYKPPKK